MDEIRYSLIAGLILATLDLLIVKDRVRKVQILVALTILTILAPSGYQLTVRIAKALSEIVENISVTPTVTTTFHETKPLDTFVSGKDGMTLVYVPRGEFTIGSNENFADEQPTRQVYVGEYWIDQTEVTNQMYTICVAAGSCTPPRKTTSNELKYHFGESAYGDHPVLYISWYDANQYCAWAGRRLPTEAEWEKAARGTDGRLYPWGNEEPQNDLLNFIGSGIKDTTEVYRYPLGTSPYGAYDMAGNVYEWVSDPSPYQQGYYLVKGGFWLDTPNYLRASARRELWVSNEGDQAAGFRCAISDSDLIQETITPDNTDIGVVYPYKCESEKQTGIPFIHRRLITYPGMNGRCGKVQNRPQAKLSLANLEIKMSICFFLSCLPTPD
jgi:formylglycine-generating enzyme required for sulfatase activity